MLFVSHQSANATMPNVKAKFFQFFRHPGSAAAAQRQVELFSDVGDNTMSVRYFRQAGRERKAR